TLICSLLISQIYAQAEKCAATVSGRVLDSDNRLPLSGVTIIADPGSHQVITDAHGYFRISQLCPAMVYTVKATSVGFDSMEVEVVPDNNAQVNIVLHHSHILLHDVTVVGHQQAVPTTNSIKMVSQERIAQARGKTLADLFSTLPGVTMLQTGTTIARPVINGLHSNRILILDNGIRHVGQLWGSEHGPEIDPFVAKDFKLIDGADGVRYGAD